MLPALLPVASFTATHYRCLSFDRFEYHVCQEILQLAVAVFVYVRQRGQMQRKELLVMRALRYRGDQRGRVVISRVDLVHDVGYSFAEALVAQKESFLVVGIHRL